MGYNIWKPQWEGSTDVHLEKTDTSYHVKKCKQPDTITLILFSCTKTDLKKIKIYICVKKIELLKKETENVMRNKLFKMNQMCSHNAAGVCSRY